MQISSNYHSNNPLNDDLLNALKKGNTLILNETGHLRRATKYESFIRWIKWDQAKKQNKEVAECLIKYLNQSQFSIKAYKNNVEALSRYVKVIKRTDSTFKRLENSVFAHKCILKLPSLKREDLITKDGDATNDLLPFLKKNLLHNVIFKANFQTRHSALLIDGNDIYIRSKEGNDFLKDPHDINLILSRLPKYHHDKLLLQKLKLLVMNTTQNNSEEIQQIYSQLESGHYFYKNLKDIITNKKGILLGQAYLADGIEEFQSTKWTELKPNFRQLTGSNTYKFRIVTHLPKYALKKTWYERYQKLIQKIFDFGAHGHSWVELCEPITKNKHFTQSQNIYNVGYYIGFFIDPLNKFQRLESADHQCYIPHPSEQIVVEEVDITKEQFEKAKLYVTEVQLLLNKKKRRLDDKPKNPNLTEEQIRDIQHLYQSTIKSTCLGFANTLEEIIVGIEKDNRGFIRRCLLPKKAFKILDAIDTFFHKTFFLKWFVSLPSFFARMELPYFVEQHISPKIKQFRPRSSSEQNSINV